MSKRFRRLRLTAALRDLIRETDLRPDDFIQPYFVIEGRKKRASIVSLPGVYRLTVDELLKEVERFIHLGGKAGLIFGIPSSKDLLGSRAYEDDGVVQKAVTALKKKFPRFLVITDVCLCSYTSHGHCGIIKDKNIDNDVTLGLLAKTAVSHARAGSDMVAPSDMMDLRVRHIRDALDQAKFQNVSIMSYAVKYASAFYGPFREAASATPTFGDRKTYQMDSANSREALKEARQDIDEGADLIMVKPALAYLDIVALLRNRLLVPIAAYSVSGEYAMIKAAAARKWIDEKSVVLESLLAMKRAGADIIISYYAKQALEWIK